MNVMTKIAFATLGLFATSAFAASPFSDNHATTGTVLLDSGSGAPSAFEQPTGHLAAVIDQGTSYGSVLFDLDRPAGSAAGQPAIGDDDYGSILYDLGARY
jgi:hypothetical protein